MPGRLAELAARLRAFLSRRRSLRMDDELRIEIETHLGHLTEE